MDETEYCCRCVSCGSDLRNKPLWMARYQVCEFDPHVIITLLAPDSSAIVYSTRSGIQLSDVYTSEFDWYMEVYDGDPKKLGRWYSMHVKNPPKAFLIHEICWFLLEQHFEGGEIDLARLFEIFRDIPPSGRPEHDCK